MLEETFSQGDSLLHRTDPRVKILAAALLTCVGATLQTVGAALAALGIGVGLVLVARLARARVIRRLLIINGFIAFLWIFLPFSTPGQPVFEFWHLSATREGLILALLITCKSNALILCIMACIATSPIPTLGHALASIGLPAKFIFLLLISYRYVNVILEEYNRLWTAALTRGFSPGTNLHSYRTFGNLVAMVLVRSYDRAQRVYQAMLLRGFQGTFHSLHTFTFSGRDILCGLTLCSCSAGLIWLDRFPPALFT